MSRSNVVWGLVLLFAVLSLLGAIDRPQAWGQEKRQTSPTIKAASLGTPIGADSPIVDAHDRPLPISLPTALRLANGRAIDIALASERIRQAAAQLDRAKVLWLPTVFVGGDYFRHDGQNQATQGDVSGVSRSSLMAGAGPSAVFAFTDAFFAPLSARQVVRARTANLQAATNDTLLAVAEAYFTVQQAQGELAGLDDAAKRAEDLVRRTEKLAEGLVPAVEVSRARADLAERRQDAESAREKLRVASAELLRLLRLDPTAVVQPVEPPHLRVTLIPPDRAVDDLIPIGLTARPELAAQQALVQAALARLRQERIRPLVPSVLLRGASTPVTGTLAGGVFGGGRNDNLSNFSARSDFDVQILWEFQNLGFGNRALIKERRSEHQQSILELFRVQDRVAAEIAQAHAQSQSAAIRAGQAESGLKEAIDSVEKNFEGMGQTKRAGNVILLVIRPQEAVAAVQALGRAYSRYYGAVADYNRAQYRLYRALGEPGQMLADGDNAGSGCVPSASMR
ncbi:MAG: TolC family protein [Planctomycetes bacterium]|nr:TolC family protein [Planctomycetota bacterium]